MRDVIQFNGVSGRVLLNVAGSCRVAGPDWPAMLLQARTLVWTPSANVQSIGSNTVAQITARLVALGHRELTGTRAWLWNQLQWLRLVGSLKDEAEDEKELDEDKEE